MLGMRPPVLRLRLRSEARVSPYSLLADALLAEMGESISGLVSLDVDDEEITKRILLRGQTSGRSDDNDPAIIRNRIAVYKDETTPVANHYEAMGKTYAFEQLGGTLGVSCGVWRWQWCVQCNVSFSSRRGGLFPGYSTRQFGWLDICLQLRNPMGRAGRRWRRDV